MKYNREDYRRSRRVGSDRYQSGWRRCLLLATLGGLDTSYVASFCLSRGAPKAFLRPLLSLETDSSAATAIEPLLDRALEVPHNFQRTGQGTSLPPTLLSRQAFLTSATMGAVMGTTILGPDQAHAATEVDASPAAKAALDAVRTEVTSPTGGVAYLTSRVQQADFPALLEYTKTYDPVLRKTILKRANKLILTTPAQAERATQLSNAVSFDLIGINKSARPGQESQENAAKYVKELEQDLTRCIALLVEAQSLSLE